MIAADANHFERLIGFLKEKRENITFHDIITLAEVAAQSMQGFFKAMDAKVYRELREIAGYIESMRTEIGALQVNDLKESRIPSAGQELGAIVAATEAATDTIMTCAEALMGADASDPVAYKALVDEKMMIIFEACSFQDITGQRITKVVRTLKHIEGKIDALLAVFGADFTTGAPPLAAPSALEEDDLLNGPALPSAATNTQADIDAILASFD